MVHISIDRIPHKEFLQGRISIIRDWLHDVTVAFVCSDFAASRRTSFINTTCTVLILCRPQCRAMHSRLNFASWDNRGTRKNSAIRPLGYRRKNRGLGFAEDYTYYFWRLFIPTWQATVCVLLIHL